MWDVAVCSFVFLFDFVFEVTEIIFISFSYVFCFFLFFLFFACTSHLIVRT